MYPGVICKKAMMLQYVSNSEAIPQMYTTNTVILLVVNVFTCTKISEIEDAHQSGNDS